MNRYLLFASSALLLAACGSSDSSLTITSADGKPTWDAVFAVDHPWFPLRPGAMWSYAGESDGMSVREEVVVQRALETIASTSCLVMVQQRFEDDRLDHTTIQWYSGDPSGQLWLFGEQTLDDTGIEIRDDSWIAGRDGAVPVPWLSRRPVPGDHFELPLPNGFETVSIRSTDAVAYVPAGTFVGCLETTESPESGTEGDLVLYAPGIGRVLERDPTTRLLLIDHR